MTRFTNRSTFEIATRTTLGAFVRLLLPALRDARRSRAGLHAGDQPLDSLVDRSERVLAQDGALGLVVEFEVHPVDGEIPTGGLGGADEFAAQPRAGGLRRLVDGVLDLFVGGDARRQALALQQIEDAPAPPEF